MEGGRARGSRNRTMSHAIPEERFLEGGRGSQCDGEFEDQHPNDLSVGGARLILQEEVIFEERETRRSPEKNFTKMDENVDLKNRVGIEMN
jgi:hypothetical protein